MRRQLRRLLEEIRSDREEVEAARRESRETVHLLADGLFRLQSATEELKDMLSKMGERIDD